MSDTAPFESLIAERSADVQAIARALRALVHAVDPDTVEVVRPGDKAVNYGIGPQKMKHGYAYLQPHGKWVNLGLYKGASLDDPAGLLEGTGKNMRHVKVRSVADAGAPALRALLTAAVAAKRA